jgi:Tripartite tricarboxylate transporter family receptor
VCDANRRTTSTPPRPSLRAGSGPWMENSRSYAAPLETELLNQADRLVGSARPMRFLVGFPPGGATDILARLIGQRLSERLGQQFVIENKPGAGNNIGTEAAINSQPDGCTVLLVNPANYINTTLYANLKFDFVRDIAPIASFNRVPNVMTVNKGCAGEDRCRIYRLCEGQSRQDQHGVIRQRHLGASVRRNFHGDDRREDAARALSRMLCSGKSVTRSMPIGVSYRATSGTGFRVD